MTVRVAINGFGRIGRNVVRALYESGRRAEITVVAINELADAAGMAHLLKYDTSHGRFAWEVRQERDQLFVGDDAIRVLHERSLQSLPWRELGVDVVLDCTGVYGSREHGEAHIAAGAKKVLFSHPGSNDLDATVVYGVNQDQLRAEHRIVSNASCTTNCIIPVIKLLDDAYGIESGTVTTIHSAMHDQQVIDAYHPDLRRTRAASQSIIPVDTKLAAGITRFFPQFTELPLVSVDFNHDPHSAIVDGTQTRVSGAHLIKTLVWCDNEWGFANRMLDTTLAMATVAFR